MVLSTGAVQTSKGRGQFFLCAVGAVPLALLSIPSQTFTAAGEGGGGGGRPGSWLPNEDGTKKKLCAGETAGASWLGLQGACPTAVLCAVPPWGLDICTHKIVRWQRPTGRMGAGRLMCTESMAW